MFVMFDVVIVARTKWFFFFFFDSIERSTSQLDFDWARVGVFLVEFSY